MLMHVGTKFNLSTVDERGLNYGFGFGRQILSRGLGSLTKIALGSP